MKSINLNSYCLFAVLLIYIFATIFISSYHEVWKDEAAAVTLASDSHSIINLIDNNRNFGHPFLWPLILFLVFQIFPHFVVLKIVNLTICIAGAYIFLKKSPFEPHQKTLFLFGLLMIYIYPIISRNYGLTMLLLFSMASLYPYRWEKISAYAVIILLLALTHVHTLIIAIILLTSLIFELIFLKIFKELPINKKPILILSLIMALSGILLSIFSVIPDSTALISHASNTHHNLKYPALLIALIKALIIPGKYFPNIFGVENPLFTNIIIFSTYIYLFKNRHLLIMYASGIVGLTLFFALIFTSQHIRHQGIIYLWSIVIFWISFKIPPDKKQINLLKPLQTHLELNKNIYFTFLLILQICAAYPYIQKDIIRPYSSSKNLSNFIKSSPELNNAIILSEYESSLESIAYYLKNPLYFFSEEKFGKYRRLERTPIMTVTLNDLLNKGHEFKSKFNKPVLIMLSDFIKPEGPYSFTFDYQKTFSYSKEQFNDFLSQTVLLKSFSGSISHEDYDLYLLK